MTELFDLHPQLLNAQGSTTLLLRLMLDLFFTSIVVFGVYARRYGNNQYLFTYVMFNLITFTLCFLLRQVPIELGFALGLFAVFGILRYRTEPIQINDLTYLFVVIGLGILNAVVNDKISLSEVLIVNCSITGLTAILESTSIFRKDASLRILYDDFEILKHKDDSRLIEDLKARTGLQIKKIKIERLDLLRETAELIIFYETKNT
ncbi:MAG: DUF4956 domain-containing protein [Proteobacteria bacterium]|nr:DUF4956 domain-containing protein [Pseudomonadota bacterium]